MVRPERHARAVATGVAGPDDDLGVSAGLREKRAAATYGP